MKLETDKKDDDGNSLCGLTYALRAFTESMDSILKGKDDVCEFFIGL